MSSLNKVMVLGNLGQDPELRYTTKSQHLRNVRLRGSRPASLVGNDFDNRLIGNRGDNTLTGGGGRDDLVGGAGTDTAVFRGPQAEYQVTRAGASWRVVDQKADRDGETRVREIERLRFSDGVRRLGGAL